MKWLEALKRQWQTPEPAPPVMTDFLAKAREEVQRQIDQDRQWYQHLPYQGGMSPEQAREFEIEKRAVWRRVIFDAGRSQIWGLAWSTRGDELVCPLCREQEGRRYPQNQLDKLAAVPVHLGCRCELLPVRS
ncbi:MAG: hypothetical protein V1806_14830 [Pseudomonadota bacterium]